ncbi:MAG: hypothetical protein MMC23_003033 [Stictis urceolatum]|nr:hypothetical protein [Stictis urceolata]
MASRTSGPGTFARVWARWKALNLPWRRQRLVGMDLQGTTYWEFRDQINVGKMRRIAKHPRSRDYSDVEVSPQWHQWLRYTRNEAPTLQEQQQDVQRQKQLKQLAQLADERWNSKASYLDAPQKTAQAGPATRPLDRGGYVAQTEEEEKKHNPWKAQRGGPSEGWQPQAWKPGNAKRD